MNAQRNKPNFVQMLLHPRGDENHSFSSERLQRCVSEICRYLCFAKEFLVAYLSVNDL